MKGKYRTGISLLLSAALLLSLLTGCGSGSTAESESSAEAETEESTVTETGSEELQTIRVAVMTGQPDQYAIYIGTQEGIFEKYGIEVETTEYVAGIYTIDAIVNGTADTGMMADYACANRLGNTLDYTDLVIFSELTMSERNDGGLYVAPEYVDNLEALDGSTGFITMVGTVTEYYVSRVIEYLGLDEDEQNLINIDSTQTALALVQEGSASAYITSGSNATYVESYGWELAVPWSELGIITGSYLLTTEGYLEENAELLANYLLALQESLDYITDHLDEATEKVVENFGVVDDDFQTEWTSYTFALGLSTEGADHLQEIADWALEHGSYDTAYDVRQFYNAAAAEIAFPDKSDYE